MLNKTPQSKDQTPNVQSNLTPFCLVLNYSLRFPVSLHFLQFSSLLAPLIHTENFTFGKHYLSFANVFFLYHLYVGQPDRLETDTQPAGLKSNESLPKIETDRKKQRKMSNHQQYHVTGSLFSQHLQYKGYNCVFMTASRASHVFNELENISTLTPDINQDLNTQ